MAMLCHDSALKIVCQRLNESSVRRRMFVVLVPAKSKDSESEISTAAAGWSDHQPDNGRILCTVL